MVMDDLVYHNLINLLLQLFIFSTPFSNLHASRLLISMTKDGVIGPAGRPRAFWQRPRPDGVPPEREL
jgi:hypothetical protein